ncbi:AcrB/AcrD/AcrF family protein [Salmonella enterica]|nr:AcrB/AcrD/AcrF family protein [Salmonella enterica]ECH8207921.1 AcrB/AcrD/AcrF family protein [Salmonella enterica subsp. enterica]
MFRRDWRTGVFNNNMYLVVRFFYLKSNGFTRRRIAHRIRESITDGSAQHDGIAGDPVGAAFKAQAPNTFSAEKLDEALYHGAVLRVRPKAMTVAVIIAGLLPVLWGTGAGSEVMSRIVAPMIGGMITVPLLSLFIIPAAYKLMWLRRHRRLAA